MKKKVLFLFIFIYLSPLHNLPAQIIPEPSGRRLREIVDNRDSDHSIIIGGTTGAWAFGTGTGWIMDREFSYVTPENDFKQWNIHPDPNRWNWVQSDAWISHIDANDQILRMHCPIGPQCSSWTQTDSRTAEELEQVMREFMQAVCERYNDEERVVSMDVVNETVQGGSWKRNESGTGGWEMPWYKIGRDTDANKTPLFIRYAFEIANQYAPDLKFIYNHHEDPNSVSSWNLIKTTIGYLRDLGLRVDGIGWQAHVDNGWATSANLIRLGNLIDWAHENELEFHVTEASVWIHDAHTESAFQIQAETYSKIVEVLLEKRFTGKVGWNIWHIEDGHGWNVDQAPSLFDANYIAKPAYYAIQEVLENAFPEQELSNSFQLYHNYPNPFNSTTTISYDLLKDAGVIIKVYNLLGHEVKMLVNENQIAGYQSVTWNGTDDLGNIVSSGAYIYRLQVDGKIKTKKMLYIK
jgi:endo-1,4-beta-xylanase